MIPTACSFGPVDGVQKREGELPRERSRRQLALINTRRIDTVKTRRNFSAVVAAITNVSTACADIVLIPDTGSTAWLRKAYAVSR